MNGRWSVTRDRRDRVVLTFTADDGQALTAKLALDDAISVGAALLKHAEYARDERQPND